MKNADRDVFEKIKQKIVENPLLKTTANTITALYYAMKMGLPLSVHDVIMELLRRYNVISGPNYCTGPSATRAMLMNIANTMNKRLITELQSSHFPVTLSLDG